MLMHHKIGPEFFSKQITKEIMVRYFKILKSPDRKMFIPILSDGESDHYYFEQLLNGTGVLRVFINVRDLERYIKGESTNSEWDISEFSVLEADLETVYLSVSEIAEAGVDLDGKVKCVMCTYVAESLVEFDMFWSNEESFFN